ncbi:hypothetical protein [uncultured Campylobacter sp.]|uniref:hypothetical protein n=1 Tax=uncultured Campylobacter sp. TaxID=218934 RepID=UPI002618F4BB|nr:hypothetical protein [uncultured Campylobacter sp.]
MRVTTDVKFALPAIIPLGKRHAYEEILNAALFMLFEGDLYNPNKGTAKFFKLAKFSAASGNVIKTTISKAICLKPRRINALCMKR